MLSRFGVARFALAVAALLLCCPRALHAQLAPTGSHYGTRSTDTGDDPVRPNENGDYSASVPLDLPPARGGLPIPLAIVSGTRGFGAAGLGWDIPLSYVLVDRTYIHRRPAYQPNSAIAPRDRVVVVLPGRHVEMVPMGDPNSKQWIGASAPDVTMAITGGNYQVFDGQGFTYTFLPSPQVDGTGAGLWPLDTISGGGNASVKLHYTFDTGGAQNPQTMGIDLASIDYNPNPTASCYKTEILLRYESVLAGSPALAVTVVSASAALTRNHKLDSVDVQSRSTCGASLVRLRRYSLSYQQDLDTGLQRLSGVAVSGRDGTPEMNTNIPIAAYTYGTATSIDSTGARTLQYTADQDVTWPANGYVANTTLVSGAIFQAPGASTAYATLQSLTDFTGDGRPDLVFMDVNGHLQIVRNQPTAGGSATFSQMASFTDTTFTKPVLDARSSTVPRFGSTPVDQATEEYVWRQAIDVNGDGRIDLIDAAETPNRWIVYLNKPDTGTSGIKWVRRAYDVTRLRAELVSRGLTVPANYLPLSRRISGRQHQVWQCFKWNGSKYVLDSTYSDCQGTPFQLPPPGVERTYVEWSLTDVNGDGYPDVVFNAAATQLLGDAPTAYEGLTKLWATNFTLQRVGTPLPPASSTADVLVAFNVAGLAIYNDNEQHDPFSASAVLISNRYVDNVIPCGVELWSGSTSPGKEIQVLKCALADVNGDGLVDRVDNMTATLGTGAGFNTVQFALPSYLDVHMSGYPDACPAGQAFQTYQWNGLRDLTGDGIPDFVFQDTNNLNAPQQLAIGTGAGFSTVHMPLSHIGLSNESERCDGSTSNTTAGLFDVTGDGKPDFVSVVAGSFGWTLKVSELTSVSGVRGAPEAGRLITIDNGAGALTTISYRSAKEDATTPHQVPYPEIVVDHTDKTDQYHLGGALSRTSYAYGNISPFYDSALDAFRSTGYLRSVKLVTTASSGGSSKAPGSAEIVDRYRLDDFSLALDATGRYMRYQRVGQASDSNVLAVATGTDPWTLLTVNMGSDTRRMQGGHADVNGRVFPATTALPPPDCMDFMDPFDFETSLADDYGSQYLPCASHGFAYISLSNAWHGAAGPPMAENVETETSITAVDDSGRPTSIFQNGDVHRTDDDLCIDITYAAPALPGLHVPSLRASTKVWGCAKNNVTYAEDYFEYDGYSQGIASQGLLTSHTVHRHAMDTGQDLGTIREFDIAYDSAANATSSTTTREDGATRTTTVTYDEFGLFPVHISAQGSGLQALTVDNTLDPVSGDLLASTDATGTTHGAVIDGFGRPVYETVQQPSGNVGVLTARTYLGFDTPSAGRQVQVKTFTEPVDVSSVASSEGRIATTYLDELARPRFSLVQLGDDYASQTLVVGFRTYDGLGRVSFEADPYPTSQDATPPTTAYGTTQFFNQDGSLDVSLRGRGPQAYSTVPDDTLEKYPTVYAHSFDNNQETTTTQTADALVAASPQFGVVHKETLTATGRVLSRSTFQSTTRLEYSEFSYDHLAHQASMTRYQDASTPANPVTWTWKMDSLGQILSVTEPTTAPQSRTYSNWGELLKVQWTPSGPEVPHNIQYTYDALGRLTHSEEWNGTVRDPDSIFDYGYDTARASPITDNLYTLGRLSYAVSPTSETRFGYDAFGNVNARTFIDSKDGSTYVQQDGYHADGSKAFITLSLPDASYVPERMDYEYDTAGRLRWMWFNDGTNTKELFSANDIDVWGRLRAASFGPSAFTATFADTGRRLPQKAWVTAGATTQTFSYVSFDAVGRGTALSFSTPLVNAVETRGFDALGRLKSSNRKLKTTTTTQWAFTYDPLGNIANLNDQIGAADATLSYLTTDRDQICRIGYGNNGLGGTACNVTYNSFGNVSSEPTRTGTNNLSYMNSGAVRRIANAAGYTATFHYDPFGQTETLDITSSALTRSDHHYGPLIEKRYETTSTSKASYISRLFPSDGFVVTRRGPQGPWVYEYSDTAGARFTADDTGVFAQNFDYAPFGEEKSSGATFATTEYSSNQWNEGDGLEGFGLVHVGARIYDPVIGRFLSRDPLMVPRTSTTTNPYAFAFNDPVNFSDPMGMDPCGNDPLCISSSTSDDASLLGSVGLLGALAADLFFDSKSEAPVPLSNKAQLATYFSAFDAELGQRQDRYVANQYVGHMLNVLDSNGWRAGIDYIGDVNEGFANGLWNMTGMFRHPLQTLEGFGYMATHPLQTAENIVTGAACQAYAIFNGDGKALGEFGANAFGPGLAAKAAAGAVGLVKLAGASDAVSAYEVGTYDALKARSRRYDALDIHHAGQAHAMEQVVDGYTRTTGPSIALPEVEHGLIPNLRGEVNLSPRDLLAQDIWNLRRYTNAPVSSLQELIQLNKTMYPQAFAR